MARDLGSIARFLDADLQLGGALTRSSRVAEAMAVGDHVTTGHTSYVTLLVGDVEAVVDALRPDKAERTPDQAEGTPEGRYESVALVVVGPDEEAPFQADPALNVLRVPNAEAHEVLLRLQTLLAVDAAAEDRAVLSATKVLTLAARRSGAVGVVVELARRVDGWAVLLDTDGEVIARSGAGSLHVQDAVAVAFRRPVRVRNTDLQVHPVGEATDVSAHLVVSSRRGSTTHTRNLSSQAAALLDLVMRTHDGGRTERLGRATMMGVLREGGSSAVDLLHEWGVRERHLVAVAISARHGQLDVEAFVIRVLRENGAPQLLTVNGEVALVYVRPDHAEALLAACAAQSSALHAGVGARAHADRLGVSADQALLAHDAAVEQGAATVRYESLPTVDLLLDRLSDRDTARIAALLDPLDPVFVETLRVWLSENGSWSVSATRLGIHRQTLASRLRRIEESTGLSMDSPDDRAAAWLAIRARGSGVRG